MESQPHTETKAQKFTKHHSLLLSATSTHGCRRLVTSDGVYRMASDAVSRFNGKEISMIIKGTSQKTIEIESDDSGNLLCGCWRFFDAGQSPAALVRNLAEVLLALDTIDEVRRLHLLYDDALDDFVRRFGRMVNDFESKFQEKFGDFPTFQIGSEQELKSAIDDRFKHYAASTNLTNI